MNKVVDNLLKNVEEFEIFFNEYEKQFYPEIRKARKMLLLFLCLLIVGMFGDLILVRFFSDSSYNYSDYFIFFRYLCSKI